MQLGLNNGRLTKWNDAKGFGFIQSSEGGKEIFLHISAIKTTGRRPKNGDIIFYALTTGKDGKLCASNASIQGVSSQSSLLKKTQSTPNKKRIRRDRLLETILTIIGISFLAMIVLVQIESGPSRSPTLISSITKPGCIVKGNVSINTGNKYYHIPGMENYDNTVINPKYGEKWFCSEKEAVAAGWQKAPR